MILTTKIELLSRFVMWWTPLLYDK